MRINDMARMQNFDVNKILGTGNNKSTSTGKAQNRDFFDPAVQADMYTPSNTFFIPPNWNHMISKSDPIMSDGDFEKAIWEMAWQDAANGLERMSNPDTAKLRRAYVSVISPDRKAAYAHTMAQTGGKLPIDQTIYGSDGRRLMHYSPNGLWLPRNTPEELSRMANFNRMYQEAYAAYEAEHGKVQLPQKGPVTVTRLTRPY
jgi:hypothetical protein